MVKSLNRLEEMFVNEENWESGIGFIFTKTKNKTVENILDLLNNNPPRQLIKWINFMEKNQDYVFFFPKPSKKDVGNQYDFEDHERLLEFIQLNPLVNPNHKITLSEIALLKMKEIRSIHLSNVYSKVQNICNKINEQFHNEKTSNEIKHWIDIMHALIKRNVKTAKEFGNVIKEIIPNSQQYEEDFKSLEEFELFDTFIDKVLYKVEDTSCLNDVIQSWCHQCIYRLVHSHTQAVESESNKREIEQQKKMIDEKDRLNRESLQKINEIRQAMQDREVQFQKRIEQERNEQRNNHAQEMQRIQNMINSIQNQQKNPENSENAKMLQNKLEEMTQKLSQMEVEHKKEVEKLNKVIDENKKRIESLKPDPSKKSFFGTVAEGFKKFINFFK